MRAAQIRHALAHAGPCLVGEHDVGEGEGFVPAPGLEEHLHAVRAEPIGGEGETAPLGQRHPLLVHVGAGRGAHPLEVQLGQVVVRHRALVAEAGFQGAGEGPHEVVVALEIALEKQRRAASVETADFLVGKPVFPGQSQAPFGQTDGFGGTPQQRRHERERGDGLGGGAVAREIGHERQRAVEVAHARRGLPAQPLDLAHRRRQPRLEGRVAGLPGRVRAEGGGVGGLA
jgi:hypothetical protein